MHMHGRHVILIVSVFCAVCFAAAAAVDALTSDADTGHVAAAGSIETAPTVNNLTEASRKSGAYIVKTVDGQIAVFEKGEASPLFYTDIEPLYLRASDSEDFERGVEISSYDELIHLLEDYSN